MSEPQPNPAEFSSFADWCLHKKSLSPEARHTVEMLLNEAYISNCKEADQILLYTQELDFSKNKISNITPLKYLINLICLDLSDNKISDITPLLSLTNLIYLNLSDNQISDLNCLQYMTKLEQLDLCNNQVSDITHLQFLTNLKILYLGSNLISNITPLQSLPNLKTLYLGTNLISNINPINYLTNLTNLELSLTQQQTAILIGYCQKWAFVANSTDRIDCSQAAAAIKAAYISFGLEVPEIIFCSSPHSAITEIKMQQSLSSKYDLMWKFYQQMRDVNYILSLVEITAEENFFRFQQWHNDLIQPFWGDYGDDSISTVTTHTVTTAYLLEKMCIAELCISEFSIIFKQEAQKALECLKQILAECGWIFTFENVCYVCDRPTKLSLDSEYRLHAEGESAIAFSDGYKLYSYHGVTLPEKYGQIHPNQWEASWILEEENAELRRVLIQGIGYARICSELQATDLDTWQEYTLLRIDADIDGFDPEEKEPIYLLKMTCPSTGFIHALRVPPDMQSAREAIRWVNWDVDYEEFSVQT
jgi:internalin A